jgi:hypothetical protein
MKFGRFCWMLALIPLTIQAANVDPGSSAVARIISLAIEPVVVSKSATPLSEAEKTFLKKRDGDSAMVWVFFTDKQIFTRGQFQSAAATITIPDKSMKRRAKTGLDHVVFADLPIVENYVTQIESFGARVRHRSNWLNAVSFVVPSSQLDEVAALPFVAHILPLGASKRIDVSTESLPDHTRTESPQSALALNYGAAASQLGQINVAPAHNAGYHGEGVTLAMFDTGYRRSHEVFTATFSEGRFVAQHDFVFGDGETANEPNDDPTAWNHGTLTWSTAAGMKDGQLYGPAYKADIILCKTEDIRSETVVEEDNWLAAVEWVSTLGADVISSSLSYSDWYTNSDYDGRTCISTVAANMADTMGMLVVNAAGNAGHSSPSIGAPADAFNCLTVGAVNSLSLLASFSSSGPTFDGRIKPEVCARGVSTACATSQGDNIYGGANGTSLSTPLVAGAACLVIQARPGFPPSVVRQALMETANNSNTPNDTLGWGIINTMEAINWGAGFTADVVQGDAPMTVQFTGTSPLSPSSWYWDFGDGQNSTAQSPSHLYTLPGLYTVSLTVQTAYGPITNTKNAFILAFGDTLSFSNTSNFAGKKVAISVNLANSQPLQSMIIPIRLPNTPYKVRLDSIRRGSRTSYFESILNMSYDTVSNRYTTELVADNGGGSPMLVSGSGEVLKVYGTIDKYALGGVSAPVDTADLFSIKVRLYAEAMNYAPKVFPGLVTTENILRCDTDYSNDGVRDIADITRLIDYLYLGGQPLITIQSGDCDADFGIDIADLTYLIGYLFLEGPPPIAP